RMLRLFGLWSCSWRSGRLLYDGSTEKYYDKHRQGECRNRCLAHPLHSHRRCHQGPQVLLWGTFVVLKDVLKDVLKVSWMRRGHARCGPRATRGLRGVSVLNS